VRLPLPLRGAVLAAIASTGILSAPALVSARAGDINAQGQGTLLFIGDSLTVGADAFGALATNLRRSGLWSAVVMDAKVGRKASQGVTTLADRMETTRNPTAIVIALGTNDMISQRSTSYPADVIDRVMNESLGVPVLWVTPTFSVTIRPDWRQRAARFNRALRAARTEWPNLTVADWAGYFSPKGGSRFIADGVHLTVTAYKARASWTVRETTAFGRAIIAATTTTTSTTTTTTSSVPSSTTVVPTSSPTSAPSSSVATSAPTTTAPPSPPTS
jgi:lysophospholipase L1-like esterase